LNVQIPATSLAHSRRLRYSTVAIVMHWATAAAILVQIGLGWRLDILEGLGRSLVLQLHKTVGIAILLLTAARLAWRLFKPKPMPNPSLTPLEARLSHLVHVGFYAALLALPLSGWAAVSMERSGAMKLIGGVKWPDFPLVGLLPNGLLDGGAALLLNLHYLLVWAMFGLLALHVAGALKHHFVSKDETLSRMAPGAKPGDFAEPRLLAIPAVAAVLAALVYLPNPPEAKARPRPASLAEADVYLDIVGPALERRCGGCHSDDQARGGLSLTGYDSVMQGGREGPVVIPRDPKRSELLIRVHLPRDDKRYMPQGEKPPLGASQIAAIETWIAMGAPRGGKVGTFKLTDAQKAALQGGLPVDENAEGGGGNFGGGEFAGLPKVPAGDAAAIKALEANGFVVRPIAADSNLLDVGYTVKKPLTDEQMANLKKIGPQILRLNLHWSDLTDAQLKTVAGFSNLRILKLDYTGVTDAGVSALTSLKSLESLSLTNTKLSDAGVAPLGSLAKLDHLYVWGSGVTKPAAERLEASKPGLKVDGGLTREDVPPPGPLMQPVN
jgi:cytochrome b561